MQYNNKNELIISTMQVLNAAAITKPRAIEHLATDLVGYKTDTVVITETHLKAKHADHSFRIEGYKLYRDRAGRRGCRSM